MSCVKYCTKNQKAFKDEILSSKTIINKQNIKVCNIYYLELRYFKLHLLHNVIEFCAIQIYNSLCNYLFTWIILQTKRNLHISQIRERCDILAKSTIEAVKLSEAEANEIIENAKREANRIISEAKAKGKSLAEASVAEAKKSKKNALLQAEQEAEEIKSAAKKDSSLQTGRLRKAAADKAEEAQKAIIDTILK